MRKYFIPVLLVLTLLFTAFASSCASGVDKNQYDRALQELNVLRETRVKAEMYALFLDILMSPYFLEIGAPSRYQFTFNDVNSVGEWVKMLDTMAITINDSQLTALLANMKKNTNTVNAVFEVQSYVLSQITTTLK